MAKSTVAIILKKKEALFIFISLQNFISFKIIACHIYTLVPVSLQILEDLLKILLQ